MSAPRRFDIANSQRRGALLPRLVDAALALLTATVLILAACRPDSTEPKVSAPTEARPLDGAEFRYDREYPSIRYTLTPARNRVARLIDALDDGTQSLDFQPDRGYLGSLLDALEIEDTTQMLVFSATSLQADGIRPETPRAIYFNDDTYLAFVQQAPTLEIATMDEDLGPVFYTLAQDAAIRPAFERQIGACLRCHDSYSMTGGGVPRFIVGSGYIGTQGQLISHEGWILTSDSTPLRFRWGGWYVSGLHGEQVHLGNFFVDDVTRLEQLEQLRVGNLSDLTGVLDTSRYPTDYSDIVALLVFGHQTRVQNVMTRVSYDLRTLLASDPDRPAATANSGVAIAEIVEPLVQALTLTDEAPISDRITGTSGFTEYFSALGPRDSQGRSLRDLNLTERLFEFPLSYMIYSAAFDALPAEATQYVYGRLDQILRGADTSAEFAGLDQRLREAALEILLATKPEFAASLTGSPASSL